MLVLTLLGYTCIQLSVLFVVNNIPRTFNDHNYSPAISQPTSERFFIDVHIIKYSLNQGETSKCYRIVFHEHLKVPISPN